MNPRHQQRSAGFTIIEMVIVLLVIAIAGSVAVPRFLDALAAQRADTGARRVLADLKWARQVARTESRSQSVVFDPATDVYALPGVPDLNRPATDYSVAVHQSPTMATLATVDFGGSHEVTFDGFGVPDSAGTVVVQVGSHSRTVVVEHEGSIEIE